MMKLDFYATWPHYADHLIPIYKELGEQAGDFFVSDEVYRHLQKKGIEGVRDLAPTSKNPMLVSSNNDLRLAHIIDRGRPYVLMEHGVGIVFPNNPSYAGSLGHRRHAALTLAPNQHVYDLTKKAIPAMEQELIGTPKMDPWYVKSMQERPRPRKLNVAVTFHWDASTVAPEAGTAFGHYKHILPSLNIRHDMQLFVHLHPKTSKETRRYFEMARIHVVNSLEVVFETADVLVNDCSSILYEFMLTGKPVILMNAPWFRKDVDLGIRFWRYSDIGEQLEGPESLLPALFRAYDRLPEYLEARRKAQKDLYPYFGTSSKVAANALRRFLRGL